MSTPRGRDGIGRHTGLKIRKLWLCGFESRRPHQLGGTMTKIGIQLEGIKRCPHCGTADPTLSLLWRTGDVLPRATSGPENQWAFYVCASCGDVISAKGWPNDKGRSPAIVEMFPPVQTAHDDLPETAKIYLNQAHETLHAPDAAAVMAGSAVDAMLKELKFLDGSVYSRIDQAKDAGVLTNSMAEWAHSVRLGSNRPRHADKERPNVTSEEARQSLEFTVALGNFLFVLPKRIERGIEAAQNAKQS